MKLCPNKIIVIFFSVFAIIKHGAAQELELFELDDYLNPLKLRTSLSGAPIQPRTFFVSRIITGADRNYQFRNEMPHATVGFVRLSNSYYFSDYQMNFKVAWLGKQGCTEGTNCDIPNFKGRLQLAAYEPDRYDTLSYDRLQFSVNVEKEANRGFIHEFSFDVNITMPLTGTPLGGMIIAWKPSEKEWYIGVGYKFQILQWRSGSNVNLGYGFSHERTDKDWHWGVFRYEITSMIALPFLSSSIHIVYAKSQDVYRGRHNQEIGAFINVPVFVKLYGRS